MIIVSFIMEENLVFWKDFLNFQMERSSNFKNFKSGNSHANNIALDTKFWKC